MMTAIKRANPDLLKRFDKEIEDWAERVASQGQLRKTWVGFDAHRQRLRRGQAVSRPGAEHQFILDYLLMCSYRIVSDDLRVDPYNRRILGRTIARLEERIAQLRTRK